MCLELRPPRVRQIALETKGPITYSLSSSQRVHDYHLQRETNISQCYVRFHISFMLARSPKPTACELLTLPPWHGHSNQLGRLLTALFRIYWCLTEHIY